MTTRMTMILAAMTLARLASAATHRVDATGGGERRGTAETAAADVATAKDVAAQKEFNEARLGPGAEDPLVYRYKPFASSYAATMHRRPRF